MACFIDTPILDNLDEISEKFHHIDKQIHTYFYFFPGSAWEHTVRTLQRPVSKRRTHNALITPRLTNDTQTRPHAGVVSRGF
jgi:hypothetical protein